LICTRIIITINRVVNSAGEWQWGWEWARHTSSGIHRMRAERRGRRRRGSRRRPGRSGACPASQGADGRWVSMPVRRLLGAAPRVQGRSPGLERPSSKDRRTSGGAAAAGEARSGLRSSFGACHWGSGMIRRCCCRPLCSSRSSSSPRHWAVSVAAAAAAAAASVWRRRATSKQIPATPPSAPPPPHCSLGGRQRVRIDATPRCRRFIIDTTQGSEQCPEAAR